MEINKRFRKIIIKLLIFVIIFSQLPIAPDSRVYAEYTTQSNILSLNPTADIFTSSSTSNGNRRMLFVRTYTDYTVCLPDSCPPIYTESKSFLKFDFAAIPSQYIS